jgi:hypothetical protein
LFSQDKPVESERRTLIVIIAAVCMTVEIAAGQIFGSMALLVAVRRDGRTPRFSGIRLVHPMGL